MSKTGLASLKTWLAAPLESEVAAAIERLRRSEDVRRIAIMPDVHLAKDVCVGTVIATRDSFHPAAVGGDIGCSMPRCHSDADANLLDDLHTRPPRSSKRSQQKYRRCGDTARG